MKLKKLVSVLLVAGLAGTLLAGCGTTEENADVAVSDTSSAETEGSSEFTKFDEPVTIDMYGLSFYGSDGLDEVMDAINAISEEKINVHVNYTVLDTGTYSEQIGLMMSGGENMDLVMATVLPAVSFSTMQSQNELTDISDYLDTYAPEMEDLMSDYVGAMQVGDAIYGMPCYRVYNSSAYIIMRKDILDELGLTEQAEAISSWDDYEQILLAVQAAQDTLPEEMRTTSMVAAGDAAGGVITSAGTNGSGATFADNYGFDNLGDSTYSIYVDDDGNVGNYYATDSYKTCLETVKKWYDEGLVYKDSATTSDQGDTLIMNGVTFSYCGLSEVGVETSKKTATGYDVVCVDVCDVPIQTANGTSWGWCVPVTSENPEAAVAFMNLMYTDPDIENLFVYGIEGRDYELNDEGEAVLLPDTMEYQNSDFFFGNQFLAYPAEGSGGNFREEALASMDSAEVSPYYGFTVNTDEIANEITAVQSVINQYNPALTSGMADISTLDTMISAMDDAGMQKIIDYYQTALDEWLAEQ